MQSRITFDTQLKITLSFFLEQKQANMGLGQWGYEGVGQGGGEKAVLQYHRLYWYVPL